MPNPMPRRPMGRGPMGGPLIREKPQDAAGTLRRLIRYIGKI